MIYTIFQLPMKHENCFRPFSSAQKVCIDINDYVPVWREKLEDKPDYNEIEVLDMLFCIFNNELPDNYAGRSLSVSDIVLLSPHDCFKEGRAYYCDNFGWKPVPEALE